MTSTADNEPRMTVAEHLEELRRRLILALAGPAVALFACFIFLRNDLLEFVMQPPFPTWRLGGHDILVIEPVPVTFTQSTPYATFLTAMIVSAVVGVVVTLPWSLYHLWAFIAAGLRPEERRWVRIFGPASAVLFLAGAAFFYFVVYPMVVAFLYSFGDQFNRVVEAEVILRLTPIDQYVAFVMLLTLVFALMFELPLAVYFLGCTGLVDEHVFRRYRRHVIVGLVAASAIVTPPDVFSQVALAVPMLGLYELGIFMVATRNRRRAERQKAEDDTR